MGTGPRKRTAKDLITLAAADFNLIRAEAAMLKAITRFFPIRDPVFVEWGNGLSSGVVAAHGSHSRVRYIGVRLHTGKIHWKHYSEIKVRASPR